MLASSQSQMGAIWFSEIRTKNGKLLLLQNKLVRCQLSIGCIGGTSRSFSAKPGLGFIFE
jgi:hypothetical protein